MVCNPILPPPRGVGDTQVGIHFATPFTFTIGLTTALSTFISNDKIPDQRQRFRYSEYPEKALGTKSWAGDPQYYVRRLSNQEHIHPALGEMKLYKQQLVKALTNFEENKYLHAEGLTTHVQY